MKMALKRSMRSLCLGVAVILLASGDTAQTSAQKANRLPDGYVAARGATTDAKTGLPKRIMHTASGVVLVLIPAGEFWMGSPKNEANRLEGEDRHRRIIRQPFYLGETEVTVAQFRRFSSASKYQTDAERGVPITTETFGSFATVPTGDREWSAVTNWRNPFPNLSDYHLQDTHPVVHVSWNDAKRFSEFFGFQLPTEAQWEYAARAGTQTSYFWGERAEDGASFANVADAVARRRFKNWGAGFSFADGTELLATVGRYRPNAWGLYDMIGNALEWVEDAFVRCYPGDGADETAVTDDARSARVLRGGSWLDSPTHTRSAVRVTMSQPARRDFIGFRVVKRIEP